MSLNFMSFEYLPQFAACRDIGHQWDYVSWGGGKRTVVCYNCTTKRTDHIDHHGKIHAREYQYPKGYHVKRTPQLVRQLRRMLEKEARKLDRWVGTRTKHNTLKVAHLRVVK